MCREALICLLLALWITGAICAQGTAIPPSKAGPAAFAEGKKLVDEGKDGRAAFRRAMQAFLLREHEGPMLTARAQNLGNAAFLAGDLQTALLVFRLGLFYDRHNAVLRENLAYARSQVRYPPNSRGGRAEADFWPSWLPRFHSTSYFNVGAVCYCLAWITLTSCYFRRTVALATLSIALFALSAGAGYGCHLLAWQLQEDMDHPPVVIRHDGVALRTGNGVSYPQHAELPTLARGMEARKLCARGPWLQIQFASGEIGWVEAQDVLRWVDLRPQR